VDTGIAQTARRPLRALGALLLIYLLLAYVLLPFAWRRAAHRHPSLDHAPDITRTGNGIPGDPLNIAIIGSEDQIKRLLLDAGWMPADPITFRSSLKIAAASVLRRPDPNAPVSDLYLWGRKQDLAFQQPFGSDPRRRHHVRFWRSAEVDEKDRPLWIGAATFDRKVGFSHTTGQVTHHIDADVDKERNKLLEDLRSTGRLEPVEWMADFHAKREGKNGGGDPWYTDARLAVVTIAAMSSHQPHP
jgi:LssY C-terminus